MHEKLSEPLGIHSVIPRGSILGPVLFLSLQKYLASVLKNYSGTHIVDSTLYTFGSNPGGGGALGYFGGGYVPPGTPNWHSNLKQDATERTLRRRGCGTN